MPHMEFVTSGRSGICVKYVWDQVNFQEFTQKNILYVKFAKFRLEFSQNNLSEFVFE